MPGTLFVVATPIGNLEDITLRALRVLREATVIAAEDTRRTGRLLARHAIVTPTTSLHEHNESAKSPTLLARLTRGDNIALVSDAGTPTISDPGSRLIRSALEGGIKVEAIPGPSAVTAALAVSGVPTESFTFLGFPPNKARDRAKWFERVGQTCGSVVFFEAPHRIRRTLEDLLTAIGDREVIVCRELTKLHEQLVKAPISAALEQLVVPRGEFTIVVDLDHKANNESGPSSGPVASGLDLAEEFGQLIEHVQLSRRQAVATLAKRHRLPVNQVYSALEELKKSTE